MDTKKVKKTNKVKIKYKWKEVQQIKLTKRSIEEKTK